MVSGSQTAEFTCNDCSGINVRSFCSRWGRHETLLFLTVITKVLVEWITEPAWLRACHILMEQSKENAEVGRIKYCRTSNIYLWLQTLWSSQIEKNKYISYVIMISNIFEYQYNFIFHWKKFLKGRCVCVCVCGGGGGGGHVFLCRTGVIIIHNDCLQPSRPHQHLSQHAITKWTAVQGEYRTWLQFRPHSGKASARE